MGRYFTTGASPGGFAVGTPARVSYTADYCFFTAR
jgi:hypothetical protein